MGAVKGGWFDLLKWLKRTGNFTHRHHYWNAKPESLCPLAAERGDFEMVRWLREHNEPWGPRFIYSAAKGGYRDIVYWAIENGCEVDDTAAEGAAEAGDNETLNLVTGLGAIVSNHTCSCAAKTGKLDTLIHLRDFLDCPWNSETVIAAANAGQMVVLKWAIENGCTEYNCSY